MNLFLIEIQFIKFIDNPNFIKHRSQANILGFIRISMVLSLLLILHPCKAGMAPIKIHL